MRKDEEADLKSQIYPFTGGGQMLAKESATWRVRESDEDPKG